MSTDGWRERALAVMPVGSSTNSKAPVLGPPEPPVIVRGSGCRVWDDRGREFIDFRNALGPISLGYADPRVDSAITAQLRDGIIFGHPHPLETETAELFCSLVPGAEAARFLKTGGEALAAVIRIARAHTGRDRIVQIGYNGWLNSLSAGARVLPGQNADRVAGVPDALAALHHQVGWEDRGALEELFGAHGDEIALILVAADFAGLGESTDFYPFLRALADAHGSLLAYDEIVTGFRIAIGGVAEHTGVLPDMAVLGKGIANGMPLSVYCGRREILSVLDRGEVVVSSTHGGETLSLAAASAVMRAFRDEGVVEQLHVRGKRMQEGVNAILQRHGIRARLTGLAPCPQLVTEEPALLPELLRAAYGQGVSLYTVVYVNAAHSDADIDEALARLDRAWSSVE